MNHAPVEQPVPARSSFAKTMLRVGAGAVAVAILIVGSVLTLGFVVLAAAANLLGWWVQRKRRKPLTRLHVWMVGVIVSAVAIVVVGGLIWLSLPEDVVADARTAAAAAEAAPKPDWLERISPAPGSTPAERFVQSPAFTLYLGLVGGALAVLIMGNIVGTLGWAVFMLAGFSVRGYWPLRKEVHDAELSPA